MALAGGTEVAEKLGDVFVRNGLGGFEFDDEFVIDEKIGEEVSEDRSVAVGHLDWMLLLNLDSQPTDAVAHAVFIDFFKMSVAEPLMKVIRLFTDAVAEFFDFFVGFHDGWIWIGHKRHKDHKNWILKFVPSVLFVAKISFGSRWLLDWPQEAQNAQVWIFIL